MILSQGRRRFPAFFFKGCPSSLCFDSPPRAVTLRRGRKSDISGDDISRKRSTKEHFVSLYDRRSLSWSILFAAGLQPKQETRRQTLSETVQTPPPAQGGIQRLLISLPYTVHCADFKKYKTKTQRPMQKGSISRKGRLKVLRVAFVLHNGIRLINKRKRGESRAVRHHSVWIPHRTHCHSPETSGKSDISGDDISWKRSTKEHFVSLYDRRSLLWSILFAAGPNPNRRRDNRHFQKQFKQRGGVKDFLFTSLFSFSYSVRHADFKKQNKKIKAQRRMQRVLFQEKEDVKCSSSSLCFA
ncbi:hypothetical protein CEXT_309041 [Caerostris extrusa]|uniref:Uncharacterized protein n=1 Tax=Caerostris extrusa TaxID=172846 RepID=A0AAV4XQB7_CAEEX|nr:hypothetical protein CEXT_309041 [Caerostris extrusa]